MNWIPVVSTAVLATLGVIGSLAAYHKWYGSKVITDATSESQRLDLAAEMAKVAAWFEQPGPGQPDFSIPAQLRELHEGQEQISNDVAAVKTDVANQSKRLADHLREESALSKESLKREQERDKRIDTLFAKLVDPRGK